MIIVRSSYLNNTRRCPEIVFKRMTRENKKCVKSQINHNQCEYNLYIRILQLSEHHEENRQYHVEATELSLCAYMKIKFMLFMFTKYVDCNIV